MSEFVKWYSFVWKMKVEQFGEFSIKHFNSADEVPEGFKLYFHHLSSQTGADPLAVLWGAALNEQPAVGSAYMTFGQPSRIDTYAANHILQKIFHIWFNLEFNVKWFSPQI